VTSARSSGAQIVQAASPRGELGAGFEAVVLFECSGRVSGADQAVEEVSVEPVNEESAVVTDHLAPISTRQVSRDAPRAQLAGESPRHGRGFMPMHRRPRTRGRVRA
jgi:hypothetical protein